MFYAQNREDSIINNIITQKYGIDYKGSIIEIGANDGVTLSNSKFFIDNGWKGFLVEAARKPFEKLLENTKEGSVCFNLALGITDGKLKFYESGHHLSDSDVGLLSSIVENETVRWKKSGVPFEEYEVDCFTWDNFIKTYNLQEQKFDIISIDIEGLDYELLSQMNLNELGCKVLCVEFNGKNREKYVNYVNKFDMQLVYQNLENLIFVK